VETRFLLVNQDWFEQIGFDLDLVINANNNQFRAAQATDPTLQPRDFFDFSGQSPTGNGLQRSVTGARFDTAGNDAPVTQGVVNPRPWSPIGFLQNSFGLASALTPTQGIAADVLSVAPALGIAGQFLDDIQVDFLIQATQADRRSVQLTAPRLTFTNGQTANIFVATQVSFVSDLTPVVGDSAVGFDPDVNVVSEGVTLLVEGTISADRRYVTLNVDAGVARIDGFAQTAVTAVAGGQLVNSADTSSFIQLPQVTVTRVRTTVTVPDQGTILLGGQRLITEFDVETGVPVLSKIPVLNRFFTNRIESKEEQTLLILLKPTVLIQNEQEQRNFPGLLDSIQSGLTN
jgi:type II secretory pathway component GspD/PulD (secretin)